ncbi:Uncharacterised protein [Mycobacteroides abscessus subsp. abscessus]|nr:Uncharacterised protein [Mycobacteroides abscessus subsp. abscessus]
MPRIRSILIPSAASSRATAPNARAVTGRPSTTMVCVDGSLITELSPPNSTSTSNPRVCMASSSSSCSASTASLRPCAFTSTPRVSLPRMTTCSTFSRSTPWRDNTPMSTEVTPGLSAPVTVTRTVTRLFTTECRGLISGRHPRVPRRACAQTCAGSAARRPDARNESGAARRSCAAAAGSWWPTPGSCRSPTDHRP